MSRRKKATAPETRKTTPAPRKARWRSLPWHHLIALGLIAAVALLVYSNTFHAPFHFDDQPNILMNPNIQIRSWSWDSFERLVRNTYKDTIRVFSYLTLALNYWLGGVGFYLFIDSIFAVPARDLLFVSGALAISSTAGLIAVFAPGGLGIREGVLVYLLSHIMPGGVAVVLSILTRLWMTLIEVGLIGMIYIYDRIEAPRKC